MKKLIWTLSALALTGLCFSACDDDEEAITKEFCESIGKVYVEVQGVASCADAQPGEEDCHSNASLCSGSTPYCVQVPNGNYLCSGTEQCGSGLIRDNDGYCVSENAPHACKTTSNCDDLTDDEYICGVDDTCVKKSEAGNVYRYVRIDDMSDPATACANKCDDPGADIDAIVVYRPSTGKHFVAEELKGYNFPSTYFKAGEVANDPKKALGEPDAFTYDNGGLKDDNKCRLYGTDDKYTYASLGGQGGYIEVEMGGAIKNGDRLDVLEIGGCNYIGKDDTGTAVRDSIKVQVSVTAAANSWVAGKTFERSGKSTSDPDKGLLSWNVDGLE